MSSGAHNNISTTDNELLRCVVAGTTERQLVRRQTGLCCRTGNPWNGYSVRQRVWLIDGASRNARVTVRTAPTARITATVIFICLNVSKQTVCVYFSSWRNYGPKICITMFYGSDISTVVWCTVKYKHFAYLFSFFARKILLFVCWR